MSIGTPSTNMVSRWLSRPRITGRLEKPPAPKLLPHGRRPISAAVSLVPDCRGATLSRKRISDDTGPEGRSSESIPMDGKTGVSCAKALAADRPKKIAAAHADWEMTERIGITAWRGRECE